MRVPLVDLRRQYLGIKHEVDAAMHEVVSNTSFILGPSVEKFEREFAMYCQAKHCVGVSSGTDAIALMLRAFGIGPGDEVIVPAFTFIATAIGVTMTGATPVFADVNPETGLMEVDDVDRLITGETRAIMPVHLYGRCADAEAMMRLYDDLYVFEDACQAHGASIRGRRAGSIGHAAAFSFYPGKNLGCYGDGGAVTTGFTDEFNRMRALRNYGSVVKYQHPVVGYNCRLDSIQAAVLSAKLPMLDHWNGKRNAHANAYDLAPVHDDHVYHVYHLRARDAETRDWTVKYLNEHGIGAGIHYPQAVHQTGAYAGSPGVRCPLPNAEHFAATTFSLPMFPELSREEIDYVVARLSECDWQ
jgi:dTDP-4-amino-4,6-dideoxygalactose transaminase